MTKDTVKKTIWNNFETKILDSYFRQLFMPFQMGDFGREAWKIKPILHKSKRKCKSRFYREDFFRIQLQPLSRNNMTPNYDPTN